MFLLISCIAYIWAIWSCTVFLVQGVGVYTLFRHHASPPRKALSPSLEKSQVPHVTIIRPVKGLEPRLYDCLASTFRQTYPKEKLSIHICVSSTDDPSYAVVEQVVADFPGFDSRVYLESQDPLLHGLGGHAQNLGPNPKIRNISRGYREAKGDIIWVIDCNVWVAKGVAGRMVDKLCGFGPAGKATRPFKFVHQLPLVVDLPSPGSSVARQQLLSSPSRSTVGLSSEGQPGEGVISYILGEGGGRLEEMFMATTHAKFYSAINTVGVAPCIVGKSNMFRKSHLDRLTDPMQNPILRASEASRGRGIDFFSSYICEDHLIGDLLWRSHVPGHANHGLVYGDLAIQPMSRMSILAYVARRVRWLRVRKWTVLLATLVEPGVESLLCCFYFAFAMTTIPWVHQTLGVPQTWLAMGAIWLASVNIWMLLDWCVYRRMHACQSTEVDEDTPAFARGTSHRGGVGERPFGEWLLAWLGRELLALPIWTWAVLLGTTVAWRGEHFRVRTDMSVVKMDNAGDVKKASLGIPTNRRLADMGPARSRSKDRVD